MVSPLHNAEIYNPKFGGNIIAKFESEPFSIKWNHSIDKGSLKIKEFEHVLGEKAEQLFRNSSAAATPVSVLARPSRTSRPVGRGSARPTWGPAPPSGR